MRSLILLIPLSLLILIGCNTKQYPECHPKNIVGDWGVTQKTAEFGEYDSLYYLVNPVGNVSDSLYYNGNYTDSYYHSDSTRVTLQYTVTDSIMLCMDRMYAVQTNPSRLMVIVRAESDSLRRECVLHMVKDDSTDAVYRCGPDSLFREMLFTGDNLQCRATNPSSSAEPIGSQNYEFIINTAGFQKALALADSLNTPYLSKRVKKGEKADSIKKSKHNKIF